MADEKRQFDKDNVDPDMMVDVLEEIWAKETVTLTGSDVAFLILMLRLSFMGQSVTRDVVEALLKRADADKFQHAISQLEKSESASAMLDKLALKLAGKLTREELF